MNQSIKEPTPIDKFQRAVELAARTTLAAQLCLLILESKGTPEQTLTLVMHALNKEFEPKKYLTY